MKCSTRAMHTRARIVWLWAKSACDGAILCRKRDAGTLVVENVVFIDEHHNRTMRLGEKVKGGVVFLELLYNIMESAKFMLRELFLYVFFVVSVISAVFLHRLIGK